MGLHRGDPAASCFSAVLAGNWENTGFHHIAREKILEKNKNFDCILEKMGYNKME
jgi:hypothetical protein